MDNLIISIISEYRWTYLIKRVNQEYHQNYCYWHSEPSVLKCRQCYFAYNYRNILECSIAHWVYSVCGHQYYPFHKYKGFKTELPKNY